jgi:predicted transcriptional regulator
MADTKPHRDKIHIIKDIIMLLAQYGQLNQTALVSYCGLNLKKHKHIFDELESNQLITRSIVNDDHRTVAIYKVTRKGLDFCRDIIGPYEELFPRRISSKHDNTLGLLILI